MSKRSCLLLAGLLATPAAMAGGVVGNPCENAGGTLNGTTVTLPNNEVVECAGSTVANPASRGVVRNATNPVPSDATATVTNPPQPLDPIRDTPGTSVDRIRGAYGNAPGTVDTVGRNGIGDTVGIPDSTGVVRGTDRRGAIGVTGTDADSRVGVTTGDIRDNTLRDSSTGVTNRDSTVPTTGATGAPIGNNTGVTGNVGAGTGTTGTVGGTGSVGGTGTTSTGTVGGTGAGATGGGTAGGGAAGGGAAGGGAQ